MTEKEEESFADALEWLCKIYGLPKLDNENWGIIVSYYLSKTQNQPEIFIPNKSAFLRPGGDSGLEILLRRRDAILYIRTNPPAEWPPA